MIIYNDSYYSCLQDTNSDVIKKNLFFITRWAMYNLRYIHIISIILALICILLCNIFQKANQIILCIIFGLLFILFLMYAYICRFYLDDKIYNYNSPGEFIDRRVLYYILTSKNPLKTINDINAIAECVDKSISNFGFFVKCIIPSKDKLAALYQKLYKDKINEIQKFALENKDSVAKLKKYFKNDTSRNASAKNYFKYIEYFLELSKPDKKIEDLANLIQQLFNSIVLEDMSQIKKFVTNKSQLDDLPKYRIYFEIASHLS